MVAWYRHLARKAHGRPDLEAEVRDVRVTEVFERALLDPVANRIAAEGLGLDHLSQTEIDAHLVRQFIWWAYMLGRGELASLEYPPLNEKDFHDLTLELRWETLPVPPRWNKNTPQ